MPTAVAKAAIVLNVARMMVEVRIERAAANRKSFSCICCEAVTDRLVADWNNRFPELLKLPCGPPKSLTPNHPKTPSFPCSGDMKGDITGQPGDGDVP